MPRQAVLTRKVLLQALKHLSQPSVPLVPIVTSRFGVEFILKLPLCEQGSKLPIRRQQSLLFTAGQIKVRGTLRIDGPSQNKRIIVPARFTFPRAKNRAVMPPLRDSLGREGPAGHINRRADSGRKGK